MKKVRDRRVTASNHLHEVYSMQETQPTTQRRHLFKDLYKHVEWGREVGMVGNGSEEKE